MKQVTKILLFGLLALSLLWSALSTLYAQELSQQLTSLRRENRSDTVYLRNRVKNLESEIKEYLRLSLQAVGGNASNDQNVETEETTAEAETSTTEAGSMKPEEAPEHVTEEVTIPVQNSPETIPTEDVPPVETSPYALYVITEHNGIIGVFDPVGKLVRTVNVLVVALPQADQDALRLGIPAYSEQELIEILDALN